MLPEKIEPACVSTPLIQPDVTFPRSLIGKLAYHSYVSYGDGTSQISIYDFSTHTLTQVSNPSWNIKDPMNAVFSPDGKWLAFMGIRNNAWNVFFWQIGTANLYDMTKSTRQNKDVKRATVTYRAGRPSFSSIIGITNTAPTIENSMPYPSVDNTMVYFATGSGSSLGIYRQVIATGEKVKFDDPDRLAAYRVNKKIEKSDGTVFYARWNNKARKSDQIFTKVNPKDAPKQLALNDCNSDNSDPWPVDGTNYVFFSSSTTGKYQLYLGDVLTGNRWSLTQFGVNNDPMKCAFDTSTPEFPAKNYDGAHKETNNWFLYASLYGRFLAGNLGGQRIERALYFFHNL